MSLCDEYMHKLSNYASLLSIIVIRYERHNTLDKAVDT